jgi:hypothetical protein
MEAVGRIGYFPLMRRLEFKTEIGTFAVEERVDGATNRRYFIMLFGVQVVGDEDSLFGAIDKIAAGDHFGLNGFPGVSGRTLQVPSQTSRWTRLLWK